MDGVLVIDKPAGPTSHDIVQQVKHIIGANKVGHLGTLDPAATGVLPLAINEATKCAAMLAGVEKVYEFTLKLGVATDTDDDTGKTIAEVPVPPGAIDKLREVIPRFVGKILQRPPAYSAVKVDGRRAYQMARRGGVVALDLRQVVIDAIDILKSGERRRANDERPSVRLRVECRSGTYVRALARDLGEALGTKAHAASIRRLRSGPYIIDTAITMTELIEQPATWRRRIIKL